MRVPCVVVIATSVAVLLAGAGCGAPATATTACTGPDVKSAAPVERLPFHADTLPQGCEPGPTITDAPTSDTALRAAVAGSFEDLGTALACDQPPDNLDVDFTHEEVLVIDFADLVTIGGVFDVGGGLVVAGAATLQCRGVPPSFQRSLAVLERAGDLDVAVRSCITTPPPPPGNGAAALCP
ncbi:MAG TPA: hypothetical protein VGO62_10970 [Myxococcota bacterium]|jgi:hypothetical protein